MHILVKIHQLLGWEGGFATRFSAWVLIDVYTRPVSIAYRLPFVVVSCFLNGQRETRVSGTEVYRRPNFYGRSRSFRASDYGYDHQRFIRPKAKVLITVVKKFEIFLRDFF